MQAVARFGGLTVGQAATCFAAIYDSQKYRTSRAVCSFPRPLGNSGSLHKLSARQTAFLGDCSVRDRFCSSQSKSSVTMGIEKELVRPGSGPKPQKGQTVTVHCTGYGKNRDLSQKFWSTKDPGQEPFTFRVGLGQVIKGWDEGVLNMQKGEVAKLTCSPDYAYGAGGFPAWGIQPNSTLLFEIEVLEFK